MGGGNSKAAQLDKYGQFFSSQEKECLTKTFHIIAGYGEATFFSEDQFQVGCVDNIILSFLTQW